MVSEIQTAMWRRPRMRPRIYAQEPVVLIGGPSPSFKITEDLKSIGMFCPSPDPETNWMCASGAEPAF